jgi:hypothetical protein
MPLDKRFANEANNLQPDDAILLLQKYMSLNNLSSNKEIMKRMRGFYLKKFNDYSFNKNSDQGEDSYIRNL